MQIIQVRIGPKREATEINSPNAGRHFMIDEIELGAGRYKKPIPYTNDFIKPGNECNAVIIKEGKIRIIT